ncbi:MAG: 30S ribosomal protein S12 methylthiotransferase RimO [Solirubrobacterales bacterium]
MSKIKVGLVSLGCDKNRIDSEIILSNISADENFKIVNNPEEADVIIVNTCGFIESSKEESINTILEMNEYRNNCCKLLVVTGCLTQRYHKELKELIPEIDIMLGVNDYKELNKKILEFLNKNNTLDVLCSFSDSNINEGERILTTPKHTAYIRIAEGCNNFCTYCIIPKIRGKFRSRKFENIINEAKLLAEKGVKELIIVAQDTTLYGSDIYGKKRLHELLRELSKIEQIKWLRVLYCYPEEIYKELIDEIAANDKVCKYLDIPIQHISNNILKRMGRRTSKEQIIDIINKLRGSVKGIVLRTSLIVGFPGETDEDFNELKEFVSTIKFDNLGVFKYSQEEGTPAAIMENQIDDETKEIRHNEIMMLQQKISKDLNLNKVGNIYDVLVEGYKKRKWFGRSYEMCPEIDGVVYFSSNEEIEIGSMVPIKISGSLEYDLLGDVYYESC